MNRVFKAIDRFGNNTEFELVDVGIKEETESEMHYRVAYSKALQMGIMPRERMKQAMIEHDFWNQEDDVEYNNLIKDIAKAELALDKLSTKGDKKGALEAAGKLGVLRKQLWQLFLIQQSSFANSCEGYAEAVRVESQMAACVRIKATGQRYWKNYGEFVIERDENVTATVAEQVFKIQSEIMTEGKNSFIKSLPEQKWLNNIKYDFFSDEVEKEVEEKIEQKKKRVRRAKRNSVASTTSKSNPKKTTKKPRSGGPG